MIQGDATRRVAIIMAGGSGERFWPLSRRERPKQLLRLHLDDATLLDEAVERLTPLIPPEHIYIATSQALEEPIRRAGTGIPDKNILAEPMKRNTVGCLAYATAHLLAKYPGESLSMAVVTADQAIGEPDVFRRTVTAALDAAEQEHALVTLGIGPSRPDTGYGYIEVADGMDANADEEAIRARPVAAFHEKPSTEKAKAFLAEGRYLWNSGMFFWRVTDFLEELRAARPELSDAVRSMARAMAEGREGDVRAAFEQLPDTSIDYALMEHARRVLVVPAYFPWDDIGTWTSLDRTRTPDSQGNVVVGDVLVLDSTNCVLFNEGGQHPEQERVLAALGLENIVVVAVGDAVLVAAKDRVQDIKRVVEVLKQRNSRLL